MAGYLDHAATTPMVPRGGRGDDRRARPYRQRLVTARLRAGRPPGGRGGSRVRSPARLGARPAELIFTSAGPRRTTWPSRAAVRSQAGRGPGRRACSSRRSSTTRCSTRRAGWPSTSGASVTWLPVDHSVGSTGELRAESAVRAGTAVVSVMWANNEVGTLQPVDEVAERRRRARRLSAHRRRAGRRARASRLRRERRWTWPCTGAQARRPVRGRRAARATRDRPDRRCCTAADRSERCDRDARRGRGRRFRGARSQVAVAPPRAGGGRLGPCARAGRSVVRLPCRTPCSTATPIRPAPAGQCPHLASPAARATRCCCCSTPRASSARPGRPARQGSPSRATCCSRWARRRCRRGRPLRFSLGSHVHPGRRRRAGRCAARQPSTGPGPGRRAVRDSVGGP